MCIRDSYKIPHGGYWSIIIAMLPLCIILLYTRGQRKLYETMQPMDKKEFLPRFEQAYKDMSKIKGTALFFARGIEKVPPYIANTMFLNNILYEDNIMVSIVIRDDPFGVTGLFKDLPLKGLRAFEIQAGYMEVFDVEEILRDASIDEKTIFYGVEDIGTCLLYTSRSILDKPVQRFAFKSRWSGIFLFGRAHKLELQFIRR